MGTDAKLRENVLEALELFASADDQLEYQRNVPIADVSSELFCLWDEVFWPDDSTLPAAFTIEEWQALLRFHSVFERICRLLPHRLPPIGEFIHSPHWHQLSRAAQFALRSFDDRT